MSLAGFPASFGAPDRPDQPEVPHFRVKWLLIADSPAKVAALKPPTGKERIVVQELPLLSTKEFGDSVTPYLGQVVTADIVNHLVADITAYVHKQGQQLVYVTVPQQNISDGCLRVVVVLGHYNLSRLLISDTQEKASALRAAPDAGQIVIQDVPLLATAEFASLIAPLFNRPITDESLATLVGACTSYARQHGALLAAVQIPNQSITGGELRLAVVFGSYPLRRIIISDTLASAAALQPPEGAGPVVAGRGPALRHRRVCPLRGALPRPRRSRPNSSRA